MAISTEVDRQWFGGQKEFNTPSFFSSKERVVLYVFSEQYAPRAWTFALSNPERP